MTAPLAVLDLVDRFQRNLDAYRSGRYKEAEVRVEFIDPLFVALGWDVHNTRGYAEAYKDVAEVVDITHQAGISLKVARAKPVGVAKA